MSTPAEKSGTTAVCNNSDVYYGDVVLWNRFQPVIEYMSEDFTGDKHKLWEADFKERFAQKPFEKALFLNCGNGYVERDFFDRGIIRWGVGFDYSIELLRQAQVERGSRPLEYFRADVNKVRFGENQFDLVVNVAALHHVQYINRLLRLLCGALKEDGQFLNLDYIGPRRNQYPLVMWALCKWYNRTLPPDIRNDRLVHPHLPTMLYVDPTEAIHSELILETMGRYFDIFERHDTGGGIAYEVLGHNQKLAALPPERLNPYIDDLLKLDRKYTRAKIVPPLFSYFIARPARACLSDQAQLEREQDRENRREEKSRRKMGTYSNREYLEMLAHGYYVNRIHRGFWPNLKEYLFAGPRRLLQRLK